MENIEQIISAIKNYNAFKGTISLDEPMASKTTFKIGGKAALFIAPENYYSFQIALNVLNFYDSRFFIVGGGSNIVFPDDFYDGAIISTQNFNDILIMPAEDCPESFGKITLEPDQVLVSCFSGTPMATLVNFCTKNNISGTEQFAGLPGTVGGAVFMNARCFEKSISDILFATSFMNYSKSLPGKQVTLEKSRFNSEEWAYKKSPFQNCSRFITTATFLLTQKSPESHDQIENECKKYVNERVSKGHFKYPSAGSVFKNNHDFGKPSGKLIDECGLKGYTIGGAQIAEFHGNFIVNRGNAKASDVEALVNYAKEQVKNKFGFSLESEIIFVDKQ